MSHNPARLLATRLVTIGAIGLVFVAINVDAAGITVATNLDTAGLVVLAMSVGCLVASAWIYIATARPSQHRTHPPREEPPP